ncbi:hypothetical protein [Aeromicrobium sp. 9AM]|uniref:hypothetical protein n=1 Tax=Aeromicrobium sp. 9AM TaxID=2653126 RepID=UPI0012F2BBD3|nr:hypothetical protein [Aeromicrobium sp. 9AM]VXB04738.1 hypothetical protein AERO9AM_10277 [Aeromicrobium sp. 9AM]
MSQATLLLLSAAVSGVVSFGVTRASTRYDYKLARRSRAVEQLTPHLYGLQDLVVMADSGMVAGREFSDAILGWNKAWNTYSVGLPRSWRFIYREANAAVGAFAGPQVFAAIDRRVWDEPLAEYDPGWQTKAEFYLKHLAACVARCDERRPPQPQKFDTWLKSHDARRAE